MFVMVGIGINLLLLILVIALFSKLDDISQTLRRLVGDQAAPEAEDTPKPPPVEGEP